MSKTNKQQSTDKNEEQTPSNVQGELPGVLSGKAQAFSKHEFRHYAKIEKELSGDDSRQKSLFLGNGFNIAIGVITSYDSLNKSLLKHATVNNLFEKMGAEFYSKIKRRRNETEQLIASIEDPYYLAFVKEIFYNKILQRVKRRYNYGAVVDFLLLFDLYFTTNYDPLLYLLLLSMVGDPPAKDRFYARIKQIHDSLVQTSEGETLTPLENLTKKQLYELSTRIIKKEEGFGKKTMAYVYRVLRDIRGEPVIKLNDGFRKVGKREDPEWDDFLEEDRYTNLFYLHGSTFFYKDGEVIRKKTSAPNSGFIKSLATEDGPMCVFAATSQDKMNQINKSEYLKHCQRRLRNIKDDLCIVGWSCGKCDEHLIACINENKALTRLLIACYGENDGELERAASGYKEKFGDKEIVFWDVSKAPFYKPRKKKTDKK